ncbi:uncharacterized protein BO80DRAFT_446047 [Aspergillus ibericus CBS 121593]|uniref:Uncharacterized protein n=1 Tax=Aspergillus ibericus CBS 121593 TaxID=1448316 RepID=A0A395H156_9EURO|nr:hypothetical protein BO80DRAFT_446047 [Aspergillus ibericus CBS 121593]RAL00034.1 hypothetical protein BO80DRAFT_446047 [Aspergillus ibericus CBS 121593]
MSTCPLPIQIQDEKDWETFATANQVQGVSIYRLLNYKSASKIGAPQYLALRALWRFEGAPAFKPQDWGIEGVKAAKELLGQLQKWEAFLQAVPRLVPLNSILPIQSDLGKFELIWYYGQLIRGSPGTSAPDNDDNLDFAPISQRTRSQTWRLDSLHIPTDPGHNILKRRFAKMLEEAEAQEPPVTPPTTYTPGPAKGEAPALPVSPSKLPSPETPEDDLDLDPTYEDDEEDTFPPVSDENIVNSYLAGFASLVTMTVPGVQAHWSQQRKGFKVSNRGNKLYEARTDGHLFLAKSERTKAIIEVKPMIHAEPNEIAGDASKNKRFLRLLFSMNRHEIYLIITEYNADYVDYLINPDRNSDYQSFLTMNQFGPWDIATTKDVENIGSLILAVTLQFSRGLPVGRPPRPVSD